MWHVAAIMTALQLIVPPTPLGHWRQWLRSVHSDCMGCGIEPRKIRCRRGREFRGEHGIHDQGTACLALQEELAQNLPMPLAWLEMPTTGWTSQDEIAISASDTES